MNNRARIAIGVAAVAAVVIAFILAHDDNVEETPTVPATVPIIDPTTTTPKLASIPTITIKDARPVGGIRKITVNKDDTVRFKVVSDTADEVHVHGYDFMKEVAAGGSVSFSFKATIQGRFEAELEDHRQQILDLQVNP